MGNNIPSRIFNYTIKITERYVNDKLNNRVLILRFVFVLI